MAVTVPSYGPEKICWRLSDEYHAPFVEGGHVRIYRERELRAKLRDAGLAPGFRSHHAHALHSPYWWLRCAVGPANDDHHWCAPTGASSSGTSSPAPPVTRWADRLLNPLLGKSLVVYAIKP